MSCPVPLLFRVVRRPAVRCPEAMLPAQWKAMVHGNECYGHRGTFGYVGSDGTYLTI